MFFKKKVISQPTEVVPSPPSPRVLKSTTYFSGYIRVEETSEGGWAGSLTDMGRSSLESYGLDDLIVYMEATLNAHTIIVDHNICNGVGPVSSSKSFLAFQVLLSKIAVLIKIKRAEETANPKNNPFEDAPAPAIYRGIRPTSAISTL